MNGFDRNRVLDLMDQHGRTKKWLARQCGISPQSLNHILRERGREPGVPVQKLMAIALECPDLDPDAHREQAMNAS